MPRKKKGPSFVVTAEEPSAAEARAADQPNQQTEDQLVAAGADEGQKAPKARITRWNPTMRDYATLDHVPAANVDEAWIKEEYGGGKYRVYFWGTKEDGNYGYLAKQGKEYLIDDSIPFKGSRAAREPLSGPVRNADGTIAGESNNMSKLMDMGLLQIFKTMQDASQSQIAMQRDHSTAMMAMMKQLAEPREGALTAIVPLLGALTPLLAPLLEGVLKRKDPMDQAREIAALVKETNPGPREGVAGTLAGLRELLELKDLLGGGSPERDPEEKWFSLIEKIAPGAIDLIRTQAELSKVSASPAGAGVPVAERMATPPARPAIAGAPASPGAPAPVVDPSPVAPVAPLIQDEWTPLTPYVSQIAALAAQEKDPYGVVQMVTLLGSAPMVAAVRDMCQRDDVASLLANRFPELKAYEAWLEDLMFEFHDEFFPPSPEELARREAEDAAAESEPEEPGE